MLKYVWKKLEQRDICMKYFGGQIKKQAVGDLMWGSIISAYLSSFCCKAFLNNMLNLNSMTTEIVNGQIVVAICP